MGFDLFRTPSTRTVHEQGFRFELTDGEPSFAPTGLWATVRGRESDAVQAVLARQAQDDLRREMQARRRGGDMPIKTREERESAAVELAVACTLNLEGFLDDGQPAPYTETNAERIYRAWPEFRGQVIDQALKLGNFPMSSSKSSTPTPLPNITSA